MTKTLTVFTPAYNRAHTIGRTYESLCRQTCQDFEWLVVDDGSKDNTEQLVKGWIEEGKIAIRYIKQENQGMHGAHNTAYRNITTELNTCIDSDDYMPDDAVEKIVSFWRENGSDRYAGIIALDATADGKILGVPFPEGVKETTLRESHEVLHAAGDKKLVYVTEIINRYPEYPIFEGEKYVNLAYRPTLVDQDYPLLVSNDVYVIVEYQDDGSSRGMWRQYWANPRGFAFVRKHDMTQTKSLKHLIRNNVHYVSHSLRAKNWHFISESPCRLLTALCILPGAALFVLNWYKVKNNSMMK